MAFYPLPRPLFVPFLLSMLAGSLAGARTRNTWLAKTHIAKTVKWSIFRLNDVEKLSNMQKYPTSTTGCLKKHLFFLILLIPLNQWCVEVRRATNFFLQNYLPINKSLPAVFVFGAFKGVKRAKKI